MAKRRGNGPLLRWAREFLWHKDSRCSYCRLNTRWHALEHELDRPTVDHVIPKARGGTDTPKNLVLACHACNSAKGSLPLLVFLLLRDGHDGRGFPGNGRRLTEKQAKRLYERYRDAVKRNEEARMQCVS